MQDLPQSPACASSSDGAKLAKDRNLLQDSAPTAAGKFTPLAREQSQTQAASDRKASLKRKRLVKAGDVVKKRAAELPAAVPASTEAKTLVRSAAVGGLALVPLPPKPQEKVQTEEEPEEDAPYWQEPFGTAFSGPLGTASSGHFRAGPALSNAAKLLRAGHYAPSQPGLVLNSPEHPLSTTSHVPGPDSSPSQAAAAVAIPRPQSGYGSSLPADEPHLPVAQHPLSTEQASAQRQQQQQQHSWGMYEHPRSQLSELTQRPSMPQLPGPDVRTLQSQRSFTGPRAGPQQPPQDPRKQPTNASLAPQGSHLQNAQGSSEQPPPDQGAYSQQPHDLQSQAQHYMQGHASEQPLHEQGHVQEQPCHQQGSPRPQSQQLKGRSRHESRHRSHSQTSQAASETPSQAVSFGVKRSLPVPVEPVKIRTNLGYRWGSHVQGSVDLDALCWATDTVGKTWDAAGKPGLRHHNLHKCINI